MNDMMNRLNLTTKEEAVIEDSDDEGSQGVILEWSLIGKVQAPKPIHISMIFKAMRPAWGNPKGLGVRSIGEKGYNLFIADFDR